MRTVVLATDAAPTYACWAPVAVRLWRRLGYDALVLVSDEDWRAPLPAAVLDELAGARTIPISKHPRLSWGNTLRAGRLVAAAAADLEPDTFLLLSDVDMAPLRRSFFDLGGPCTVQRALYQAWLGNGGREPAVDAETFSAGAFRLPMCYAGATVRIWREALGLVPGDLDAALAALVGDADDRADLDETILSLRLLLRVAAAPCVPLGRGAWRKGDLLLLDPVDEPLLATYHDLPRGMIWRHDRYTARSADLPADPIDFIPCRFEGGGTAFCCFALLARLVPELGEWLVAYERRLAPLLR